MLFIRPLAPEKNVVWEIEWNDKWEVIFRRPLAPDRSSDPFNRWFLKQLKHRIKDVRSPSMTYFSNVQQIKTLILVIDILPVWTL